MTANAPAPPPEVVAAAAVVNRWVGERDRALAAAKTTAPPAPATTTAGTTKVSDAEYARMSYGQRRDYARQFDQRQFNR